MEIYMRSTTDIKIYRGKRRGQAAIEFLLTYGWAILGALIVIGALSYFGIFNTQKYVKDVCYFGDQMTCEDYIAHKDATIGLQLRNNFGVPITISAMTIKSDYGNVSCNAAGNIPAGSQLPGDIFEMKCRIYSSDISANNKLRYKAIVTFSRTGSSNMHNQTGDVTITVQ
jgi:uncharacterized protein (UPF0333 family)